ncbi:hypothetical protein QZH41_019886, partial [Actinostola sp. cb2023]
FVLFHGLRCLHSIVTSVILPGGYSVCAFTLVMEYVGTRYRSAVGFGIFYSWTLGLFIISLLGYLIPNWRTLTMIISSPGLFFFLLWWFTPESLRWLLVKGKVDEAKKILRNVVRVNKKNISEEDMTSLEKTSDENTGRLGDVRDLFATRSLALRTLISWYCW